MKKKLLIAALAGLLGFAVVLAVAQPREDATPKPCVKPTVTTKENQ